MQRGEELTLSSKVYELLSQCLEHPSSRLATLLIDGTLPTALFAAFGESEGEGVQNAITSLAEFAKSTTDTDTMRLNLECDYNRLFVGPGHLLAVPYESAYLGRPFLSLEDDDAIAADNSVDGRHVLEVRNVYRASGYDIDESFHDFCDHIFVELDFVSKLYAKEAQSDGATAAKIALDRIGFIDGHLAKWVPQLASRVRSGAKTAFYPAILTLVEELVKSDALTR